MQAIYWNYCARHFQECQLKLSFDVDYWKEMSSFAGWNFIGCTAGLLKDQGVNILLNLFLGPIINAARGIANTVNNVLSSFAGNFMTALNPQITKSYAAGDYSYMFSLVERGSRFSYYILLLFALPMLFEADFVLTLWLKHYPANTLINLQNATGKIRNYQLAVGGMLLMNFPLSYICLKIGFQPESTLIVALIVAVACLFLRLLFLRKMVGLSMKRYLHKVSGNVICVTLAAVVLPTLLYLQMADGIVRFLLMCVLTTLCSALAIYFIGCNRNERNFIKSRIILIRQKFSR